MWWLVSVQDEGVCHGLLVGKQYIVGRKDGDIVVPADQSMSRKHATLLVSFSESHIGHPEHTPELHLTDTSKLGTMLQDERFRGETRTVGSGCQILFGTGGESKFRAVYRPCVVTTSCLEVSAKRNLKSCIRELGGHLVADWRKQCNLLVMSSLSVTIKVICAMVCQKSIVTPQYLEDLKKAVKANAKLPKANDYTPHLAESQVNPAEVSFEQNPARKTLFQGKIFIFLSPKQFKKLSLAVELAGGTPMLLEEDGDGADDLITAPHTCVMHATPDPAAMSQNAVQWTQSVLKRLHEKGLRTIQDSELGYAVLYASTERYCNPAVDPDVPEARPPPSQSLSQMPSLDPSQHPRGIKQEKPSQQAAPNQGKQKKRGRTDSSDEAQPAAKRSNAPQEVIEVKPEPPTPVRTSRKRSPAPTSPAPRRSQRRPSPSPSPTPGSSRNQDGSRSPRSRSLRESSPVATSSKARKSKSPSPSPSKQATKVSKRKSRSPSPSPSKAAKERKSPTRPTKSKVNDEFDDFDFDSIPSRRNKTNGKAVEKLEPVSDVFEADSELGANDFDSVPSRRKKRGREDDDATEKAVKRLRDEVIEEVDLFDDEVPSRKSRNEKKDKPKDVDPFDAIPTRRSRKGRKDESAEDLFDDDDAARKTKEKKCKEAKAEEIDPFDDIPTRKSRKEKKDEEKPEDIDPFDGIPSRKNRQGSKNDEKPKPREEAEGFGFDDSDDDVDLALSQIEMPDDFDDVPSRRKGKKGKSDVNEAIFEKKTAEKGKEEEDVNRNNIKAGTSKASSQPSQKEASQDPSDTTGYLSTVRPIEEQVKADPSSLVDMEAKGSTEVVEVSLIARPAGQYKKKTPAEVNTWKGRTVKNFKCFRKVGAAALSLPRIIGGSDLIVHESKPQHELDAWLHEAPEAEPSQADKAADALFDWDAPQRKGRR